MNRLERRLFVLVSGVALPLVVALAVFAQRETVAARERLQGQAMQLARAAMADVDVELVRVEAALRMLTLSRTLGEPPDLAGFHGVASDALRWQIGNNFVLSDRNGHQVVNTLRPWGEPLPGRGNPPQLLKVFETRDTVLTDLFVGPVTGTHLAAMAVPVEREGGPRFSLGVGMSPDRIGAALRQRELPAGWVLGLLDSRGTLVARSREAQRYVGQSAAPPLVEAVSRQAEGVLETPTKDGEPVLAAFSRSPRWGWAVAVGAPLAALDTPRQRAFWLAPLLGLLLWVAGLVLVRRIARAAHTD